MYKLLGTHNSATGEMPSDLLSFLGSPIAQCQKRTILSQCAAGVRLFDLRVKPYHHATRYNLYYPLESIGNCTLGHGACDYMITLEEALEHINDFGKENDREMYVLITLEGKLNVPLAKFLSDVKTLVKKYPQVTLLEINVKRPTWIQLYRNKNCKITYTKDYPLIKGWKALLPFPRFWNKFIQYRPQIKQAVYSLRDFI